MTPVTFSHINTSHISTGTKIMTVKEYNNSVERFSDAAYRFILKNIKDSAKAEDIIQDTFEKLWLNRKNVNYEKVKSYIFSSFYHTMIDLIRRDKKQTDFDGVDQNLYSHSEQYSDLHEILHQAVDKLPEIQRSVIMLRDYEGYSYKEIGDITKLTEQQVKVYIYRARQFLKQYIGSMEAVLN